MREPLSPAEREQRAFGILEQYCEELETGRATDPAALIDRHPECAAELRRLFGGLQIAERGLEHSRSDSAQRREFAELQQVERYERLGLVGKGGMGTVFRALDRRLGRVVAMKLIRDQADAPPGTMPVLSNTSLQRFLREARVTSRLGHPGIVPVYDIGVDERERPFYTMKLVEGIELERLFRAYHQARRVAPADRASFTIEGKGRRFGLHDLLGILLRICEAIAFAHRHGVIHRDLKPANVLVGDYGEVYVMDWGLARLVDEIAEHPAPAASAAASDTAGLSVEGSAIGTAYYMPPEQARGALQEIGCPSDVYAIGAMLYELLAGHAPYADRGDAQDTSAQIIARILHGPPPPLDGNAGPPELITICQRAIAYDPRQRFQTTEDLAEQLRRFVEGRVVSVYATGPWQEVRKWMQRNPALAWTSTAVIIALVLGVAGTSWGFAEASTRAHEFDQLAGVVLYEQAVGSERELYPAWPDKIPAMEQWLQRDCDRLLSMRPAIEQTAQRAAALAIDDEASRFLHATLSGLLQNLTNLDASVKPQVERRLRWARTVGALTRAHPAARVTWHEARTAIAAADDVVASKLYASTPITLRDEHVFGLVPIGMNPVTKLWEFYHLRSAWDGESDPATMAIPAHRPDGSIAMTGDTGIVFALLPGGTFTMGAQRLVAGGPNHDPQVKDDETPPNAVTLAPFFLARHEMTRGQWQRLIGSTPFWWKEGVAYDEDPPIGPAHPADSIDWETAAHWLPRLGLSLPTEAQWEYCCRGGTATPWWPGDEPTSLLGNANIFDRVSYKHNPDWGEPTPIEDGFAGPAPVGTFRPNGFGFFDMHGNLWEWCQDGYGSYRASARADDGFRPGDVETGLRIGRGGCYGDRAQFVRSALRIRFGPTIRDEHLGLRAARSLPR